MSEGYTPLFGSLTRGTLCGKWPDIGLWPVILSLANWRGEIDATPQYISTVTGLALEEVVACLKRFCAPDPSSRSQECGGAKLVLLDPSRDWGWRVVNMQRYRDRASGRDQVADGRNAEKVRRYRERHRATPDDTGEHRATPPDTYSDLNKDSDSERFLDTPTQDLDSVGPRAKRARTAKRIPEDFQLTPERRKVAETERLNPERTFAQFCDYWRAASGSNARKYDWDATWRNWCRKSGDDAKRPRVGTRPTFDDLMAKRGAP